MSRLTEASALTGHAELVVPSSIRFRGRRPRRAVAAVAAGTLLVLAGCGAAVSSEGAQSRGGAEEAPPLVRPQGPPADGRADVPSALDDRRDPGFPEPLIDPDLILSGGPPPDGIPPIDEPRFARASSVRSLSAAEPVLSLTVGEETRAYPIRVMTWHEIVNDTVGGVPVAVTYCPLCNSGVAFERRVGDRLLSFGTSGMLYADNLVMYDRQTESLWPQLTGLASVGALTGTQLESIPLGTVAWGDFARAHPQALVLSEQTGVERPYGRNPYVGYDDPEGDLLFELPHGLDDRARVKDRVVGLTAGAVTVAVLRASLEGAGPVELDLDGRPVVLWHHPGQSSALDAETIAGGADIGSVAVFEARTDGRRLHFEAGRDGVRDVETGSRWNVLGQAVAGPLKGARLAPVEHLDTFWFAWVAFHPQTGLVSAADLTSQGGSDEPSDD